MKKNLEPWSKRVWYVEALIFMGSLALMGNIVAFLVINIISLVATIIASISLRVSEPLISEPQKPLSPAQDKLRVKHVEYEGIKYYVKNNSLKLQNKNIKNILDIQGIDKLWYLKRLDLSHNNITSIDGIEHLENLRILKLSDNKIQDIKQIRNLQNLVKVYLNNNQLKEFNTSDFNSNLKHLDIAKNPIEKFQIYTRDMYQIINFGSKKDFPKEEMKRLKKMKRHKTYKSYSAKEGLQMFLIILSIWAAITFVLALVINLAFWGVITSSTSLEMNYWEFLFTQGLWTFLVGGIGAAVIMLIFYEGEIL